MLGEKTSPVVSIEDYVSLLAIAINLGNNQRRRGVAREDVVLVLVPQQRRAADFICQDG